MGQPRTRHLELVAPGASAVAAPEGFTLIERLGDGAEGGAWRAKDLRDQAFVVAKPVPAAALPAVRRAFEILRTVGSPALPAPRALSHGADGRPWLITQWVPGTPLSAGPAPLGVALEDAAAVARALAALHEAGTHHGDVSPANVVVEGRGRTLVDLAQLGRRGVGTPGFLAPEVLAGGGGPAADRYSVGALLVWRLTGEVPWSRPTALLAVRGRGDVLARLRALGLGQLPGSVGELLVRLLLPDPDARPVSSAEVARRLADLAAASGEIVGGGLRWWLPQRWPYAGAPLEPAVEALLASKARLVVVAGSAGAGRGRVVDEVVLRLQARGGSSAREEASSWAHREGAVSGSWLEAWVARDPQAPVVGLLAPPLDEDVVPRVRAASRLARARIVLAAEAAAGRALEDVPGVLVLWPRALRREETLRLLGAALEGPDADVAAAVDAVHEATGGWPAAIVRAASACGRRRARADEVRRIAASAPSEAEVDRMDPATANTVLHAAWTGRASALPATLVSEGRPHALAVARARAVLGTTSVREEARRVEGCTLLWASDAENDEALLRTLRDARPGDPGVALAVSSLEARAAPGPLLALAASRLLAEGDARRAEALANRDADHPACRFARARALQRMGRLDEAWHLVAETEDDAMRWAKRGLRWRLCVDRGEATAAAREATALGVDAASMDVEVASALLWAAYASALSEDVQRAEDRLQRAAAWAAGRADVESTAVAARVHQLRGNLAHGRGALGEAVEHFALAAQAFARAGEPVGGLTLRGTSCALAILTLDLEAGIDHGRAALRGLLAHGQTSALVEAASNLVQLLARVGAAEEMEAIGGAVEAAVGDGGSALVGARCARLRADVLAAAERTPTELAAAAYARAGAALEAVRRPEEARDAWLRAAWLLAVSARAEAASRIARRCLARLPEDEPLSVAHAAASAVLIAARCSDAGLLERGLVLMRAHGAASLRDAQRLDLALSFDRALHAAARVRRAPVSRRRAVAHRLLSTVELVMHKTRPNDRTAARSSLLSEGGGTQALRELLEDLEAPQEGPEPPSAPSTSHPKPPVDDDRYARLLRMYRRFAREERLEPLLEHVVDAVMELTDAERGAVVVRRAGRDEQLVTRALSEGSEGAVYSRSVIARVMESGAPVLSVDAAADERFDDSRSISHLNLRSVLAVPLRFRGELLGAVYVDHRLRRGNFGEDDLAHMEAFADLAALAVAHAAALADLEDKTQALTNSSEQLASLLEQREAEVLALREDARRQAPHRDGYRGIVGNSSSMQTVFRLVDRIADADVPVVIHGESGTGKELVARALHDAGARAKGPFVAENCGAIPETLLETVLFGHAKGAFTGAQKAKPGLFEAADGGTIFLDEVGEMSMAMQTKLLRVLQESEVRRVGETASRAVDVRVLAASNRDLEAMVAEGTFRRDLFYRINVVRVDLPPLRERAEDLGPLIEHFFARHGATPLELAPSVTRALRTYAWPGNVRQLENEVQRWIALCEGAVALQDLSAAIVSAAQPDALDPDDLRIKPRVERLEREMIARALDKTGNNQTQAAQLLGLSRYGLQKKLKRLEVDPHQG